MNENLESAVDKNRGTAGGGASRATRGDAPLDTRVDTPCGETVGVVSHARRWGRVYGIEHTLLNHRPAMKVMHSTHTLDDDKVTRFRREAQALVALDHFLMLSTSFRADSSLMS